MKKLLFSAMLMIVFLVPFTIKANTISEPLYQVDVTHQSPGIVSLKAVAMNAVKSTGIMRSLSQIKSADATIKMTPDKPKNILIGQCNSCHSTDTGTNGVSGGDPIGIRQFS